MARTGPILEKCLVTADVFLAFVFNNRRLKQVDRANYRRSYDFSQ
jgi:hypothetical protein